MERAGKGTSAVPIRKVEAMKIGRTKNYQLRVCEAGAAGRILNYDWNGRSSHLGRNQEDLLHLQAKGARGLSVLSKLKVGESGILVALDLPESVQNHLMHMGFVPDAHVTALRRAPAGDPTVYGIDGMEIALRVETAKAIRVREMLPEAVASPALAGAAR